MEKRAPLLPVAFAFLSILPLKRAAEAHPKYLGRSMRYFPLVGLAFGLVLASAAYLTNYFAIPVPLAVTLTVLPTVLSRGMHLDGLADSADGLLGGASKEDTFRIMRDSSVGAFGVAAIAMIFIAKFGLFGSIQFNRDALAMLVILPAMSRWACVYASFIYDPARPDGMAKIFLENVTLKEFLIAGAIMTAAIAALLPLLKAVSILIWLILSTVLISAALTRKIGGVTGDILGALIEIEEVAALAGIIIILR